MAKKAAQSSSSVEVSGQQTFVLLVNGRDISVTASSLAEAYEKVGLNKDGTEKSSGSTDSKTD